MYRVNGDFASYALPMLYGGEVRHHPHEGDIVLTDHQGVAIAVQSTHGSRRGKGQLNRVLAGLGPSACLRHSVPYVFTVEIASLDSVGQRKNRTARKRPELAVGRRRRDAGGLRKRAELAAPPLMHSRSCDDNPPSLFELRRDDPPSRLAPLRPIRSPCRPCRPCRRPCRRRQRPCRAWGLRRSRLRW
jgi:hypothetical protein